MQQFVFSKFLSGGPEFSRCYLVICIAFPQKRCTDIHIYKIKKKIELDKEFM